MVNNHTHFG